MQIAAEHMIESDRGGAIVVTSSMAGLTALTDGTGGSDAYAAAKIGVTGLVRAYAQRLAANNIRVDAIAPTGVATTMIVDNPALFEVIAKHEHLANAIKNCLPVQIIEPVTSARRCCSSLQRQRPVLHRQHADVDAGMNIA